MKYTQPILCLLALLLWGGTLFPATRRVASPFVGNYTYHSFTNLSLPLNANIVYSFFQDEQGMMWLGTKRGLFSYDGYSLQRHASDEYGTDDNSIQAMVQLERGILCLGTDVGLSWFDLEHERCIPLPEALHRIGAVRSLMLFAGELWIGSRDEGLWAYHPKHGTLRKVELPGRAESIIYALQPVGEKLYVGGYEGLSCYDSRTCERTGIELDMERRLLVNSLCWDEQLQTLWVGTEGDLYRYLPGERRAARYPWLRGNSCKALRMDGGENLLVGTDNGLYVCDRRHTEQLPEHITHDARSEQSLRNNVVWDIFCDRDRNMWLGTDRGVSMARNAATSVLLRLPEFIPGSEGNSFACALADSEGGYWLGGENGLVYIDSRSNVCWFRQEEREHPLRHNCIRHIYEDRDRIVWIATDGGIARYDRPAGRFVFYTLTDRRGILNANWSYTIYEDGLHRLWIATFQGGLFIVEKEQLLAWDPSKPFRALNNADVPWLGILDKTVYQLEAGEEGILYAVTHHGLARIRTEAMQASYYHYLFPERMFFCNHALWYNVRDTLFCLGSGDSLPEVYPLSGETGQIYGFGSDGGSSVCFSSTAGIFRIDLRTKECTNLYPSDHYFRASLFDRSHEVMLWGGEDCLLCLPANPEKRPAVRRLFVTSVSSDGQLLPVGGLPSGRASRFSGEVCLPEPGELSFRLSSFSYTPGEERYYYRLGRQSFWQALPQGENRLSFAGLAGGTYELELAAAHPAYQPGVPVSRYVIRVPYPWYLSGWAFLLYAVLLAGAVGLVVWWVHLRGKRKYARKEREKSLELSNLKMDFFVNISHELKMPLSLIIAPLSKLMSEVHSQPLRESLASIYQNSLRLNTLIGKVLDFKQMEYDSENILIRSHVDLPALLKSDLQTFEGTLREKGIRLDYASDVDTLWLNLDRLKIESCLLNLLSNALKYVPAENGRIEVSLRTEGEAAVITVADNGKGIDEQELPFVFIRFFQGKKRKGHPEGSGIGLYLVKKFIELHDGSVEVKNRRGLVVRLSLPLKGDNLLPAATATAPAEEKPQPEELPRKSLLVIDDNREMVAFLVGVLSEDYRCRQAYDGREGLAAMEEELPDLVIVDQMMPVMDGLEFCRTIRRNQRMADIPLIMLTAKDDMQTELASIRMGVDVFIPKPFDLKKLLLRIAQLLQRRVSMEKSLRIEALSQPDFRLDDTRGTPDEELMKRVSKVIEENMEHENFTVADLASLVGVEQKQLYRKLKQLTGQTPVGYVRRLRMKKAALLLEQQKFTVSEVMYLVGYTSASHFSKCFSAEYGQTPKQYMEAKGKTA